MQLDASVEIAAPPAKVWAVMVDVERWPEWTASMRSVVRLDAGPLRVGSLARIRQPRLPAMVWRVTDFQRGRWFTWETKGVGATTVAGHGVVGKGRGGATAILSVRQTGLLAWLFRPWTTKLVRRYMEMEAKGLKLRCESAP